MAERRKDKKVLAKGKKKKKKMVPGQDHFLKGKGNSRVLSQITSLVLIRTFQIDCFKGHVSGIGGNYN